MPAHLGQQHEAVSTTQGAWRTVRGPGRRGLGILGRVTTGGDGLLKFFHFGELRFARGDDLRRLHMGRLVGQQSIGEGEAAVTPQGQLAAIGQVHRHCTCGTGFQLLADKHTVSLDQQPPGSVSLDRKYLTDHLADHTD